MNVRRFAVIGLAVLALVSGLACEGEGEPAPEKTKSKTTKTLAAEPKKNPNPPVDWKNLPGGVGGDAQRPGPQADPGTCVDGGERDIQFYAHWLSEKQETPKITWTKNGRTTPATNVHSEKMPPVKRYYGGEWSTMVRAKCHDVLALDMTLSPSGFSSMCAIVDLGDGPVTNGERGCSASYVVK